MKTIEFSAIEFDTISEALQEVDASGRGVVIQLEGKALVTTEAEADRLKNAGVEFAYFFDHYFEQYDESRIVSVPVNARD